MDGVIEDLKAANVRNWKRIAGKRVIEKNSRQFVTLRKLKKKKKEEELCATTPAY